MPKPLPPYVEKNLVKGHTYLSYRRGKGPRIRLPDDPESAEFKQAYAEAVAGGLLDRPKLKKDEPGTLGALIASYFRDVAEGIQDPPGEDAAGPWAPKRRGTHKRSHQRQNSCSANQ